MGAGQRVKLCGFQTSAVVATTFEAMHNNQVVFNYVVMVIARVNRVFQRKPST